MNQPAFVYLDDEAPTPPPPVDLPPLNVETARTHYFGQKAWGYDKDDREVSEKWNREHAAVEAALKDTTGKVLDIPCGTGRFFPIYRDYGLDFIGMDVSEDMMGQAREKFPDANVVHGDIMDIPLDDKSVASAVVVRMLAFFETDEMFRALKELGRVTTERLIITAHTGPGLERHRRYRVQPYDAFRMAVEQAGFVIKGYSPIRSPEYSIWLCETA